jgi:hypothetical protein
MARRRFSRGLVAGVAGVIALGLVAAAVGDVRAQGRSPLAEIVSMLTSLTNEITDPGHGLAEIKREVRNIEDRLQPPSGPFLLSSGLFGLSSDAQSVDWMAVNNSSAPQTITVTVYRHGIGIPRAVVAPGPLTLTLAPTETTHNANSVGPGLPFEIGYYYEVQVETPDRNVLPSVHVWPSHFNNPTPGTLIPPGSWVRIQ